MLQAIRERAHGIFAWVLLIIIGVPFALWGIQNYMDGGQESPVAVVQGHKIYERDVNRAYEQSLQAMPDLAQLEEKDLKQQALERLIREELISESAADQRLRISDESIRDFIQSLPYFQTDGKFDKEKYRQMLSAQNLSPALYTEQVRKALAMEQYQRGIMSSVPILDREVQDLYRVKNQQRVIEYVKLPLRKTEQPVPETEVTAYYEQHRAEFRTPETVSIDYLSLSLEELASAVKPSDAELRTFYEEQKAVFSSQERRRVSHILIVAEQGNAEAEKTALGKAKSIRERLAKGDSFAQVAGETSEDPVSSKKGGDLGMLGSGAMDPAFEKAAKALQKNQVSDPVRTSFGYHLITVTELEPATVKGFDQVKPELVKMFQRNAADNRFYELGQKLTQLSFEHPDTLEPAAKAVGKAVLTSKPFGRDGGEGPASVPAVRDAAFSEDVLNGKNSDLIEVSPEEVTVLRMREHQSAADRPLDAVRTDILARIKKERARAEARKLAEDAVKAIEGGATLVSQAKALGGSVVSPPPLQRVAKEVAPEVIDAVFSTRKPKDGRPVAGIAALGDGSQIVYQLKSVVEAKPGTGDQEIDRLREYLGRNIGQRQYAAWIDELRRVADVKITRSER
jgi:peptidyl-prolyl cis-trans isomerase D